MSCPLSELASEILMSKITPAYNGLTAGREDLVTESALGRLPSAGFARRSHVFGCYFSVTYTQNPALDIGCHRED